MARTVRTIRRSIRAALTAGRRLVTAVRGARFATLVALFAAIDRQGSVRIGYVDSNGVRSERSITPRRLWLDIDGHALVTAFDHRDQDVANFRTDRMNLDPEPAMPVTLTRDAVTLYDIETQTVWDRMDHRRAESALGLAQELGDVLQEYATTDRDGCPLRVVYQRAADTGPDSEYTLDAGGVYEFAH